MSSPLATPTVDRAQADVVAGLRALRSVPELFRATVAANPDRTALRLHGEADGPTWTEAARTVTAWAGGLAGLGIEARTGDDECVVALLLPNVPAFHLADLAVLHAGGVPFSLYPTDPASRMRELVDAAGATVLLTDRDGLPRALELRAACPALETVVLVDGTAADEPGVLDADALVARTPAGWDAEAAWRAVGPESTACLIYTSGTTGAPKGVRLPHRAILASVAQYTEVAPFTPHGRVLSYLPAAHIADRFAGYYCALAGAHTVTCVPDHTTLYDALRQTRPTHFFAVPRILEKLSHHAADVLAGHPDLADEHAARLAKVRASGSTRARTESTPFTEVHAELGLDAAEWCTVGSAPTAAGFLEVLAALDLPFADIWGMTEIIVCAMNPPERMKLGAIGRALPGIEFRLDDGELLAKGPTAFTGYRGDPERTREIRGEDGWLRTGDMATIDDEGYVRIVGRRKEMMINSAGKNMSPLVIEGAIKTSSDLIDQVAVAGDGRRFVVGLIALDGPRLQAFARERGLTGDHAELTRHPEVLAEVQAAVERGNARLSRVESVRSWRVVSEEWRPGGEEVTASMKLMRGRILAKYAPAVDELYR